MTKVENIVLIILAFGSLAFILFINIVVFLWRTAFWAVPALMLAMFAWLAILAIGWIVFSIHLARARRSRKELEEMAERAIGSGWSDPKERKVL